MARGIILSHRFENNFVNCNVQRLFNSFEILFKFFFNGYIFLSKVLYRHCGELVLVPVGGGRKKKVPRGDILNILFVGGKTVRIDYHGEPFETKKFQAFPLWEELEDCAYRENFMDAS